jgi:quinoprotein relay system zinc metallohydrolase 2
MNRTLGLLLLAVSFASHAGDGVSMRETAPGVFVHQGSFALRSAENLGDNANIGFIVGEKCVAVIDTGGSFKLGQKLRATIKEATEKPICYVINSHVHPDHVFGNAAFKEDKPKFVGHKLLAQSMAVRGGPYLKSLSRDLGEAAAGSEFVPPDLVVDDTMELDLGGRKLQLKSWQKGHSETDISVYDEQTKTLWLSDLLFVSHIPALDGSITGWLKVMDEVRAMNPAFVIPGHGIAPAPWPQALDAQLKYLRLVEGETRTAIKKKRAMQEATEEVGYSEQKNWENWEGFHRRNVIGAYKELEWED